MKKRSPITTHVLNTARGGAAVGIPVRLEIQSEDAVWSSLGVGVTNEDGRVEDLLSVDHQLAPGVYRLRFEVGVSASSFFPEVVIPFLVQSVSEHYHVPLLFSPFGYSTYRGT